MTRARFAKLAVAPVLSAAVLLTGVAIAAQTAPQKTTAKEKAAAKATIDLNKATAEELEELPNVGPATAKKIIAGRPYTKVDDLSKAGIAERVITAIRSKVHVGDAPAKSKTKSSAADEPDAKSAKVNLNTADAAALEDLPGIGPAHAKAIIAARPFKSVDELEKVKGIGKSRSDALKDRVTVTEAPAAATKVAKTKATASKTADDTTTTKDMPKLKPGEKININTASKEELDALPGIGPVRAGNHRRPSLQDHRRHHEGQGNQGSRVRQNQGYDHGEGFMTRSFPFGLVIVAILLAGRQGAPGRAIGPQAGGPARPAPPQQTDRSAENGTVPKGASGQTLNLGFEAGNLANWKAEGDAFKGQPVAGDLVNRRRGDMHSNHHGRFWVGSFEKSGDEPQGTLTSIPFLVSKPYASFLVAGGARPETCVELLRSDSGQVIFRASGDDRENLERVVVDLSAHLGKEIVIRLVDSDSNGWGHINFDDFRLHDRRPDVPARRRPNALDNYAHAGLAPEEAARAMTVPPGFKVTLFAGEPDVVQPIAMAIDDRGRIWVAEAYSYPRRLPQDQARDRILIFEDTDGDGRFDSRKIFADHLNLVSGLEVGYGGVWVGAAPEFYFIPDKDGDDRPDGPSQVLLDGWGQHDTHETLNSFAWGPDGWLYGCHGVFTHSRVGKPGTPSSERTPINAGIWRYHPLRHVFEVFAHGTSNPWGIDFDARGQMLITACVIPHLYHIIQGGRYERQAGPHFNPYTYDDIKTIADHRHYLGANPHGGNGRSDSAGGGHAHSGALIYLGGAWPPVYNGSLFMNNIHGARLNRDRLTQSGSGFVGSHAPDFLLANDVWSQIISLKCGPDGSMFMIDWYDKNQCHHNEVNGHDRTNGRIFKVSYGATKREVVDLAKESTEALRGTGALAQ